MTVAEIITAILDLISPYGVVIFAGAVVGLAGVLLRRLAKAAR